MPDVIVQAWRSWTSATPGPSRMCARTSARPPVRQGITELTTDDSFDKMLVQAEKDWESTVGGEEDAGPKPRRAERDKPISWHNRFDAAL